MTPRLSPRTKQLVENIFRPEDVAEASQWLEEECGNNLPFCQDRDEYSMERIRFATIKLSQGNTLELSKAIDLARKDWRDVLMAADFGSDLNAHDKWAKDILEES